LTDRNQISAEFQKIQDEICLGLEQLDGRKNFHEDLWERDGGGGGKTRVIEDGALIEKGGVNYSAVFGALPDVLAKEFNTGRSDFFATGVSIVLHPVNPWVPIIHMNIRYFELSDGKNWFGGGIDLTPHYIKPMQAGIFHRALKNVCDGFDKDFYDRFKKNADDYFFIPHRNETRGVGGIFFDQLKPSTEEEKKMLFSFVCKLGRSFLPIYEAQAEPGRYDLFGENERNWQYLRRGRYVEFNLVNDRGTKFGLQTSGRTESILMSLPKHASWAYNFHPQSGSKEEATLALLRKDIDWINF
jgi:coproporphyrinogen III oxidase